MDKRTKIFIPLITVIMIATLSLSYIIINYQPDNTNDDPNGDGSPFDLPDDQFYLVANADGTYTGHVSDLDPNTSYTLQYKYVDVNMAWTYAGIFESDSDGRITTFPLNLVMQDGYSMQLRWINSAGTVIANTVTVEP